MDQPIDPELLRRAEAAIASLPAQQRDIFLARRREGLSYVDIAERTGLNVRQVERQMARAIYKIVLQMDGLPLRWWHRWC